MTGHFDFVKMLSFADFDSLALFRALFLFLVLLELPDTKVAGLNRGEAVWRVLSRLLEEPFDAQGLVASRLRGKSKMILHSYESCPVWQSIRSFSNLVFGFDQVRFALGNYVSSS